MKTNIQTRSRFIGATALALGWLTATIASADTVYQTITQAAGSQWNQAYWGTPAAIPVSTNNYITTNGFNVRTPDAQTASTFLGASLRIDTGGQLYLKNGGAGAGVATANLILNGGSISLNTANGTTISAVAGTLQVIADSTIKSLAGAATRDVWLRSSVSGSGNLTVGMVGYSLVLFGTNTAYSGNWTVNSGRIEISTNSVDALGSGSVNLTTITTSLVLNKTNDFTVNNTVSGPGVLVKLNTNTATLGGNSPSFYGAVAVSNGVLRIQSAASIDQVTLITLAAGTLDATPVGGLSLNGGIGQTLNCRGGAITAGLTASSGSTLDFNLTPTTNDILNVAGPLTLNGNPTLNLNLTGFKPAGTYRLINYTGTIQGGGSFNLVPPVGSSQIFNLDTSTPGQVNLVITSVSQNLVWVGDGSLNSWDTYSPNWNGSAVFATGDNVTFDDTGSAAPDIYLPAAVIPNNMTVSNTAKPFTFYDQGISTVGKLTKAGGNDLVFTSPSNNFTGPVEIQAGTLSIGAGGAFGSLGNPSTITNNGLLRVNLAAGGPTLDSVISGSGAVEVIGGGVLYLRGSNSYSGLTTVGDASQLNITTNDALGSAVVGTVVQPNGRLGVNGFVGALSIPEPITVSGTGLAATPGALYVNNGGNNITWAGPVTINGDVRFRVVNAGARMNFSNTVLGSSYNLQASAETDAVMTFLNTLDLGGGTLIKDAGGTVVLASANNIAGSTVISNGTLLVNGVLNGGAVTVNSGGTLGGIGTNQGPVDVLSSGTLAPGSNSVGRLTVNNTVTLSGTALMQLNRTNALNADQLVASSTVLGGALTVVNIGPSLEIGDTFSLFAGPLTGAFAVTNLPALPPDRLWDTTQLVSSGVISVITNVAFQPLIITDIKRQPGNVTVTWQSNPGQTYNVEYSLDLATWTNFVTGIPASAGTTTTQVLNTAASGGLLVPVAKYDMTSTNAVLQDGTNLVAAGPLTPGSGVNAFTAPSFQGYPTDPMLLVNAITTGTDLTTALANQAWFTFTLTVGANVTDLDLTSVTFNGARGGSATPRGYAVYATTPTTTDELVQGATDFATQRPVWGAQNVNLSALASLQNLTAGQVVTIKIPFYSPTAGGSVEFDDITVNGVVSPAPVQPPYVGVGKMFLRIKQQ